MIKIHNASAKFSSVAQSMHLTHVTLCLPVELGDELSVGFLALVVYGAGKRKAEA